MTNATKTLAAIFGLLLVITVAMKWSSGSQASQAFRSSLVNVDTSSVDKMVIDRATKPTITLSQKDQQWEVSAKSGPSYPAASSNIAQAINQLNNLSVNAVATRNPEKYTRYKVDSTGIKVSLYSGGEMLNSIYVGAPQRQGRRSMNNYVRLADEDAVYLVEEYLEPSFSKKVNDWRDKTLWEVERSNISQVDFIYPADSSFTIKQVEQQKWVSSGDTLSQTALRAVFNRLTSPQANGFAKGQSVENFGTEKFAINLTLSGGDQYRMQLKESPSDSSVYLGTADEFPYVFTVRKSAWDDYVLKSRNELLKGE